MNKYYLFFAATFFSISLDLWGGARFYSPFSSFPICQTLLVAQGDHVRDSVVDIRQAQRIAGEIITSVTNNYEVGSSSAFHASNFPERFYYVPALNKDDAYRGVGMFPTEGFGYSFAGLNALYEKLLHFEGLFEGERAPKANEQVLVFSLESQPEIAEFVSTTQRILHKSLFRSRLMSAAGLFASLGIFAGSGLATINTGNTACAFCGMFAGMLLMARVRDKIFNSESPVTAFFREIIYNLNFDLDQQKVMGRPLRKKEDGQFLYVRQRMDNGYFLNMVYTGIDDNPKLVIVVSPN